MITCGKFHTLHECTSNVTCSAEFENSVSFTPGQNIICISMRTKYLLDFNIKQNRHCETVVEYGWRDSNDHIDLNNYGLPAVTMDRVFKEKITPTYKELYSCIQRYKQCQ